MLFVLLNWLFIFIVCLGFGWWARAGLRIVFKLPFEQLHPALHLLLGLILLVIGCNLASFFIRIQIEMNLVFSLVAVGGIVVFWRENETQFASWWISVKQLHLFVKIALLFYVGIALLKSVSPTEISDEGGYYLPLIRWMETYPIVPGIANIEDRMGFNSSRFIADAFFGFSFLFEGGLYKLNSFLFLIFNCYLLGSFHQLLRRNYWHLFSDLTAVTSLVVLWRANLTSMDADYINIQLGLVILLMLARKIETKTLHLFDEQTTLCILLFAFLLTVKFSSAMLGLPLLILWLALMRSIFNWIGLTKLGVAALLILLPWMARSYVISGYPIYPLFFIKIGKPSWQVLPEIAKGQYEYIREYAKNEMECSVNDYRVENLRVHEWFPYWIKINWKIMVGKLLLVGIPLGLLLRVGLLFYPNKRSQWRQLLLFDLFLLVVLAFWFFRLPSVRFYWGGLLMLTILPFAIAFGDWFKKHPFFFQVCLCLFVFFGMFRGIVYSWQELPNLYYLVKPAQTSVLKRYNTLILNGQTIKVSPSNNCHGTAPPCFPKDYNRGLQLLGELPQAGFKVEK